MDSILTVAFGLRVLAMALFLAAAFVLLRTWRRSSLQEALAFAVLRRERRRALVSALLVLFVALGIAVGLSAYQDLHEVAFDAAQLVGGVLLLAASIATLALTSFGFSVLPGPDEAKLITDAPEPYVVAVGVVDRESNR